MRLVKTIYFAAIYYSHGHPVHVNYGSMSFDDEEAAEAMVVDWVSASEWDVYGVVEKRVVPA